MLITTSAATGGFPKPALPFLVFRSMCQVPPPSPGQRVKPGEKAPKAAVPSLSVASPSRPQPCAFAAVPWHSARRQMLCKESPLAPRDAPSTTTCWGRGQESPEAALCPHGWGSWPFSRGPESTRSAATPAPGGAAAPGQRLPRHPEDQQLPAPAQVGLEQERHIERQSS